MDIREIGERKLGARTDVEPDLAGCGLSLGSGMTVLRRLFCWSRIFMLTLLLVLLFSRHEEGVEGGGREGGRWDVAG